MSCSHAPDIEEGQIRRRDFVPAHEESYWHSEPYQDCGYHYTYNYGDGEYNYHYSCETEYHQVERHRWVEDEWYLNIYGCVPYKETEHCADRRVNIDQNTFKKSNSYHWYNVKTGELKNK